MFVGGIIDALLWATVVTIVALNVRANAIVVALRVHSFSHRQLSIFGEVVDHVAQDWIHRGWAA
jgi:hypothetical protein